MPAPEPMYPEDMVRGLLKLSVLPYGWLARDRRAGVTILVYHRVGGGSRRQIDLSPRAFEWQMQYLRQHHTVITLDELSTIGQGDFPDRDTVAITFDDGSTDLYEHAFPILRDLGLPATLYLATAPLETGLPLAFEAALPARDRSGLLSWDQVETMLTSGLVSVGAHTHTHPDLSVLGRAQIEEEIHEANDVINRRLGISPKHFAYPWARVARRAREVVERAYTTAAVGGTRKNPYAAIDLHVLRRVPVQRSDRPLFFRLKIDSYLLGEEALRSLSGVWRRAAGSVLREARLS